MDKWIIGTRLGILLYCMIRYITGTMENIPLVLLMVLSYISVSMLSRIFRTKLISRGFLVSSVVILIISSFTVNQLFILLLVIDILELVSYYAEDFIIRITVTAIPAFMCKKDILPEYILISFFCIFIFLLAEKLLVSLTAQKQANERLRDRNDQLSSRVRAGSEYEGQVRYLSQLEERNSMAQKLHDKVGHTIAGSIIQLEAAGLIIDKDGKKAADMIGNVTNNLKEGMESIRSTLRSIKPPSEQLGLNRLKLILEKCSFDHSIQTSLSHDGSLDVITHQQWSIIMDNTKEALTNALKYSRATNLSVKLNVMNKIVKAEVRDNGVGASSIIKGMGLTGMTERTENAGGKLIVDGSSGFSVIMLLPVSEVRNADKSVDSR